jgi:CDP-diacylglycerol--serine O-phosphatidyltransferase
VGVDGGRSPRRRRWQELREQRRRGIYLLPSLLTTGNLFCGFYAIIRAAESRYTEAAVAIFVAMVMDMLDGKVARLTKTTTQFGVEFDSLADVVSFGVAPAFMLYMFRGGSGGGRLARRLPFVACGALRLARFNVRAASLIAAPPWSFSLPPPRSSSPPSCCSSATTSSSAGRRPPSPWEHISWAS